MLIAKIKTDKRSEIGKIIFGKGKTFTYNNFKYNIKPKCIFRRKFLGFFGYDSSDYIQGIVDPIDYFSGSHAVIPKDWKSTEGIADLIRGLHLVITKKMIKLIYYGVIISIIVSGIGIIISFMVGNGLGAF